MHVKQSERDRQNGIVRDWIGRAITPFELVELEAQAQATWQSPPGADEGHYVAELWTRVLRVECDYVRHIGRLYLPPTCCTDISGAISFFRRLDPDVQRIHTFSGGEPDTSYEHVGGKEWSAHAPLRVPPTATTTGATR
jgi:hypothetical protein